MTLDEIRKVITALLGQGILPLLLPYLFFAIIGFWAAYLGAYAKKKAENFATKEDFENILSQLKKTTFETENVKAQISKANWVGQRQWELKKDIYFTLLSGLYLEVDALSKLVVSIENFSDPNQLKKWQQSVSIYKQQSNIAIQEISKQLPHVGVLLNSEAQRLLEELFSTHKAITSDLHLDFYQARLTVSQEAYDVILQAASKDLGLKFES